MKTLYHILFFSFCICLILSCKKDTGSGEGPGEGGDMYVIEDDFTVVGKWYFQTVEAEGEIFGQAQSDKDNMPTGFAEFNEDGTGTFNFGISLLNQDYGKIDSVTWTRESMELVRIIESDGDINDWTLIRANEVLVEASWDIVISDENFATFTSVLTVEE